MEAKDTNGRWKLYKVEINRQENPMNPREYFQHSTLLYIDKGDFHYKDKEIRSSKNKTNKEIFADIAENYYPIIKKDTIYYDPYSNELTTKEGISPMMANEPVGEIISYPKNYKDEESRIKAIQSELVEMNEFLTGYNIKTARVLDFRTNEEIAKYENIWDWGKINTHYSTVFSSVMDRCFDCNGLTDLKGYPENSAKGQSLIKKYNDKLIRGI